MTLPKNLFASCSDREVEVDITHVLARGAVRDAAIRDPQAHVTADAAIDSMTSLFTVIECFTEFRLLL